MFDRHKFGQGSCVCAQVNDSCTVGLTGCTWGVCGIDVKMPWLASLAGIVLRNVEM